MLLAKISMKLSIAHSNNVKSLTLLSLFYNTFVYSILFFRADTLFKYSRIRLYACIKPLMPIFNYKLLVADTTLISHLQSNVFYIEFSP